MSDDILSGGAIDPSTSGPIPPSEDDRSRDILSEQKGRQDQDAIGGTQLPPRPQPPPEIQEIAPPLPPIDFNISGLDLEGTKEIARQTVVDVLKNVTINGQGPSVDGSSIAFNVSQEQSASESFGNITQAARNAARRNGADIGFDDAQTARDAARQGGADISFNDAQAARDAARQKGADIDSDDAQAARDEAREERSSARAYKAAEEERRERKESDPNFDRESYVRQKGETPTEFRERQEQLRQERAERAQREDLLIRIRTGDFTEMPSGIIPVRFTRADGQKKILALMASEFVGVVDGATSGERPATLPSKDSYYVGGGIDQGCPFDLIARVVAPSGEGCPASTESILASVKHTGCLDCAGNDQYERYASIFTSESECGIYGYYDLNAAYNFKLLAKEDKSTLQIYDQSSAKYLETGISEGEAFIWGYVNDGQNNIRSRVTEEVGVFETWNEAGGYSKIYLENGIAGFESDNGNGITAKIYDAELWLNNTNNSSWSQLYAGGLYMNDGSNFVDIKPPDGKDAYFQQVSVCIDGETKTAYVLMTNPE